MEKYLVHEKPSNKTLPPSPRRQWKRGLIELNGKFEPNYRNAMMNLLMRSYSEINRMHSELNDDSYIPFRMRKGVSAVDFDNKGIYLASVTKSGCLTIHDFEALYCETHKLTSMQEDESKLLMHLSLNRQLDVVKWNPLNQDEVVCSSLKYNELLIFDAACESSEPIDVLSTRSLPTFDGKNTNRGLSDVAFASNDSRLASLNF